MTDIIQELRGLIELATPRPWEYLNTSGTIVQKIDRLTTYVIAEMQTSNETIDAALIVAAINHLPALLDRLEAAERGWQPIETAPLDMTEVLVLIRPKVIRLGWYFAPSSRTKGWRDESNRPINPTHWRPLPDAPAIREVKP